MRINLTSIFVDDQARAQSFYTEKLGFSIKHDIDLGEFRWLTLLAPEGSQDVELLLEPNAHPAAKAYQAAIYADGIPATSFGVYNLGDTYNRLKDAGVNFTKEPTDVGAALIAIFDDSCGNLVQLVQTI